MGKVKLTALFAIAAGGLCLLAVAFPPGSRVATGAASDAAPARATASPAPKAQAPRPTAPFTREELLKHLTQPNTAAAQQPEHPSAEEDARALAQMKLGIEAQPPNVQRIYYRAQVNAASQLISIHEARVASLEKNGASAAEIANAKAALQATIVQIDKSRAELARLDK